MKKILKAMLGGLGLCMVLCALFPRAFLNGDALWTYQSDVGRVDIVFSGEVENECLEVRGNNVRADEPKWLLDNRHNQGVVLSFPVSYLRETYQVTLEPQGDVKEVSLMMSFRGQDLRVDNQRKPAYVRFEDICVNGRAVVEEQTVWHDKPFRYRAKNIPDNSTVTLSFAIRKPISFTDVSWDRAIGLFIICSLLIFIAYSSLISCSDILKRLVSGLNKKDIVQVIADNYRSIDVVYRRSFWIIFGVFCFAFGYHTIEFMWGNHDWRLVMSPESSWSYVWAGRYALYGIKNTILGGVYLPLIYDGMSFLFLALNAVLLCTYWKLKKRVCYFVLCGLILTAQPFTLAMMYYVHMMPETFIGVSFVLTALVLSEKIAFEECSFMRKVTLAVFSIILINLSLAFYPVLINTIAVAFVGRLLVQSFEWNGSWKQFRSLFSADVVAVINIILGVFSYKIMLVFAFPPRTSAYNAQTLSLDQLPERLGILFRQSFRQLCEYNYPFISQGVLWIFLGFTILITLYICLTGNFKQKIIRLILLGGALFATQTAMMISNTHMIMPRVELFGLVVFETLVAVIVFTKLKKLHNLSIFAVIGVVWVSIINDLDCLRVWKLGFDAEKMLWNRVLARMELQKDFSPERRYRLFSIGSPISQRPRFFYKNPYPKGKFHDVGATLLHAGFDAPWSVIRAHEFYYQTEFIRDRFRDDRLNDPKCKAAFKQLWEAGILDKARAWPHENGLIVWKDVILFVTDAKRLENCKKQLSKEFPRQPQKTP